MAEHLRPGGRAGIIVPEGIIFQSQNAYKELRKMLVENSLVAVISLPSGVFNPYSGVKTSILILDKSLAQQAETIAFFKVENDGFGLGAQRRANGKDDLPQVKEELGEYLTKLRAREQVADMALKFGLVVPKAKIAENGDYNLSGERYREGGQKLSQYPHVELGEVVEILDSLRRPITKSDRKPGPHPYYGATGVLDHVEGYLFDEALVLVGEDGAKWGAGENSAFSVDGKVWVNNHAHVLRPKRDRILDRFLIEILNEADLMPYVTGVTVPKLNQEKLRCIPIPLPPLEIQRQIVAEIEAYQRVIDGARAVIENYRPHIPIDPEWPTRQIGDLVTINNGLVLTELPDCGRIACIKVSDMNLAPNQREIVTSAHWLQSTTKPLLPVNSVVFPKRGAAIATNKKRITRIPCLIDNNCMGLTVISEEELVPDFLFYFLLEFDLSSISNSAGIALINNGDISSVKIPLPPLETQQAIVAEIEAEQKLVAANRELIERFERKIQATLARVWGEETTEDTQEADDDPEQQVMKIASA